MITEKMQDAMNEQIKWELYSAYFYMAMCAQFLHDNLPGFANWMRVQAQEEMMHALKFYDFINERGGRIELRAVDGPPKVWASPLAAFQDTYAHEQIVTSRIDSLVDLAREQHDHASEIFLQWFVTEQVEEEASADALVQELRRIQDNSGALFMLDRELGQRVFTPPGAPGAT